MEDTLKYLSDIVRHPAEWLTGWKQENKRPIIGCAPMFVPEELVHASGALPVVLWEDEEPITLGHSRIQIFFCGKVRSLVDLMMRGKFSFIDGIIIPDICIPLRSLPGVVKYNSKIPFIFSLYLPRDCRTGPSRSFLVYELQRLRSQLGEHLGVEITDSSLLKSIEIFNNHRSLLRRLYDLRRQKPGLVKAREMADIVASGTIMPKEDHARLLQKLIPELEARPYKAPKGPRLVVSGNLCELPKYDLLDMIEELGGVIVDDEMYVGARYFAGDVKSGPPLEGLADAYLNSPIPNPLALDPTNRWGDYLVDMAKKSHAQGIISLMIKYCEPHAIFIPDLTDKFAEAKVPHFLLETEHEVVSWGQFKTRTQAFLETIGRQA